MGNFGEIDWEATQWMLKLTAIDKRAIARLNADLIPIEAFSTGLIDLLMESDSMPGGLKPILKMLHGEQQAHYDVLWKYDGVFKKVTGVNSPGPSNCIRNILSYAGMYIEELDAIMAVWMLLVSHRLATLYASLPLQRLGNIEPIFSSILQHSAVDEPLLYEIGYNYFKARKKKLTREQINRLGLIQKKFLEGCIQQLSLDDEFLSLQHAVRHLGIDLNMEFSVWLAHVDREPPLDVFVPDEDKIKTALKEIGASIKTLQIDTKLFYS
ncbi:MAG: hypothetical protein Kow0090_18480 [Myxococcota bacterium]